MVDIATLTGIVVARHRLEPDGAGVQVRDHTQVTALNAMAMTAAAAVRGPHRRKERIPPGEAARTAAAALRGDQPTPTSSGGSVIDDHGPSHEIGRLHLDWFGQPHDVTDGAVPLTLFTEPCAFRGHVITALDASQVPWRVGYEGAELVGLRAAAKAGLGVTSLIANSDQLWDLPRTTGVDLPPPPDPVPVSLAVAANGGKARRRLANLTTEAAHDALASYPFAA